MTHARLPEPSRSFVRWKANPTMLLFSRFRNAAGKAGSLLLRFLDTVAMTGTRLPPPPPPLPELPAWAKDTPAERQAILDRIFNLSPDPISKPRDYTPEELSCDPYPAGLQRSMAQSSSAPDNREVTNHYARRDAAERTLSRKGYTWTGGEEWKPPAFLTTGNGPSNIPTLQNVVAHLQERERRRDAAEIFLVNLGYFWGGKMWAPNPCTIQGAPLVQDNRASAALRGLGWRYVGGAWIAPPPVELEPGTAENLRDAIACALDEDADPGDSLQWLRDWSEGDPDALAELEDWRAKRARP